MVLGRFIGGMGGDVIADAVMRVGVDASGVKRGMADATNTVQRAGLTWGSAFKAAGIATAAIATGVAGFAAAGAKASTDLNAALSQVVAMAGASREEVAQFREEILKLAPAVGTGPKELAEALYLIKSAGVEGSEAMLVLEQSAKAAKIGMTDVQTVANGVTTVLQAYGLNASEAGRVTDLMTQAIVSGKFEWDELARSLGTVATTAGTAGIPLEEMLASMAALSQVGLTGQRSSMVLNRAILSLQSPTDGQIKLMRQLGIEFDETTLKQHGLIGTLNLLKQGLDEAGVIIVRNTDGTINYEKTLETTEKTLGNSNVAWRKLLSSQQAVLLSQVLMKDEGRLVNGILDKMGDAQGLLNRSWEDAKELNVGILFDQLREKMGVVAIRLGDEIMPLFQRFMGFLDNEMPSILEGIGDFWNDYLKQPVGQLLDAIGDLGGALSDLLFGWTENEDGAKDFTGVLETVGGLLSTIIGHTATLVGWLADLFDNEVVQRIAQVALSFAAINLALSGIRAGAGALGRLMSSTGRLFASPFGGGGRGTPVDPTAGQLQDAAGAHQRAAGALERAAGSLSRVGRLGGTGGPMSRAAAARMAAANALNPAWYDPSVRMAAQDAATQDPRRRGVIRPVYNQEMAAMGLAPFGGQQPRGLQYVDTNADRQFALRTGRAMPVGLPAAPVELQQVFARRFQTLNAELAEVARESNSFGQRAARALATFGTGLTGVGRALRDTARLGLDQITGARGTPIRRLEDSVRRSIGNYWNKINTAVVQSLSTDPLRGQGGRFIRPGGLPMIRRYVSTMFSTVATSIASGAQAFNQGFQRRAQTLFRPAVNGFMNVISGSFASQFNRGASRVFQPFVNAVMGGVVGALNAASRTGSFLRGVPQFANSMTMTLGNALSAGFTAARDPRMLINTASTAMGSLATSIQRTMGSALVSAVASPTAGAALLARRAQEASRALISGTGNILSTAMSTAARGLAAGARGVAATPGAIRSVAGGLRNALLGRQVMVPILNEAGRTIATSGGGILQQAVRTGGVLGGIRSAFGVVGRLFWPAMIASFAIDLAAAPIGDFVANTLGKTNLGAEMRDDLLGGIGTWLTAFFNGVDVEEIANLGVDEIDLGGVKLTRVQAAKMGMSRAQMEELFAEEVTLEGALERVVAGRAIARGAVKGLELDEIDLSNVTFGGPQPRFVGLDEFVQNAIEGAGEGRFDASNAFVRVFNELGTNLFEHFSEAEALAILNWVDDPKEYPLDEALRDRLASVIQSQIGDLWKENRELWEKSVREPTEEALRQLGFSRVDIAGLTDQEINQAAVMLTRNTQGEFDGWFTRLLKKIRDRLKPPKPAEETTEPPTGIIPGLPRPARSGFQEGLEVPTSRADELARIIRDQLGAAQDLLTDIDLGDYGTQVAMGQATEFLTRWGDAIVAAADSPRLQRQVVEAYNKAFGTDATFDQLLTEYQAHADVLGTELWAGLAATLERGGDDVSPRMRQAMLDMLQSALDANLLTGETKRLVQKILNDATAQLETRQAASNMLLRFIEALPNTSESAKAKLRGILADAWDDTSDTVYPNAQAAGVALLRAFVSDLPEGPMKRELKRILRDSIEEAKDETDPEARRSGRAFLEAFINALPAKYADLKRTLRQLLRGAASDSEGSADRQAEASGKQLIKGVEAGSSSNETKKSLKDTVTDVVSQAVPVVTQGGDLATRLLNAGIAIVRWLTTGMTSQTSTNNIIDARDRVLAKLTEGLPSSPVKAGPLKHPYLLNAGQKIVEQINAGMRGTELSIPPVNLAALQNRGGNATIGPDGAGAGSKQELYVDRMYIQSEQDKRSILAQLEFMAPKG